MSVLFQFVDYLLQHIGYRFGPHILRRPTEHDLRSLNQEILKYLEIQQRIILILLLEMSIDFLNSMLNFFNSNEEI